jgi:hypothetical protein
LDRYTIAKLGNPGGWQTKMTHWPGPVPVADFVPHYRRALGRAAIAKNIGSDKSIIQAIADLRTPVAFISSFSMSGWCDKNADRVREWAAYWASLENSQGGRIMAVPILCIKMPAAEPGWHDCPDVPVPGSSRRCSDIWRELAALSVPQGTAAAAPKVSMIARLLGVKQSAPADVSIKVTPILHPIRHDDGINWADHHRHALGDHRVKQTKVKLKDLFAHDQGNQGVPMAQFTQAMGAIFGSRSNEIAAQT